MSYEHANQVGKASATAGSVSAGSEGASTVGKQTLAESQSIDPMAQLLSSVKARAGATIGDGAGFFYVVTSEGAFEITVAPPPWEKSLHAVITMTGKYATAWATLANQLATTNDSMQCVEPPNMSVGQPAPAEDKSVGKPAPSSPKSDEKPKTEEGGEAAPAPAPAAGDVFWIATDTCKVKSEKGSNITPAQVLPKYLHVRVLAKTPMKGFTNAKIAYVDPKGGIGAEIGWASFEHMQPVRRPPRPSTAAAQMAAVLAAARAVAGTKPYGKCYANVKKHIMTGGGYGDILDIQTDERFEGLIASATMFHTAVQKAGAAAMGLEEISGLPMSAAPGTILVLKGTANNHISEEHGDISVIEGVSGGVVNCLNDGHMKLLAKETDWAGSGKMAGSMVGMYKPIDRE